MDDDPAFSRAEPPWAKDDPRLDTIESDREFLAIGDLAQQFGVTLRALRFYEQKGLLAPLRDGPVRRYGPAQRNRLALLLKAKKLGFTLVEILQMIAAAPGGPEPGDLNISRQQCFEQIKLLEQRRRDIESALAELRRAYSSFYVRLADR